MKVALVHDQLREFGGAERVLVSLKKIFPALQDKFSPNKVLNISKAELHYSSSY